jgi:hypothetical protein
MELSQAIQVWPDEDKCIEEWHRYELGHTRIQDYP